MTQPPARLTDASITAELTPLATVIDHTLTTTPTRLGDTSSLTAALTLVVAAYIGTLVGDVPARLAAKDTEIARLRAQQDALFLAAEDVHTQLHTLIANGTAPGSAARAAWTDLDAVLGPLRGTPTAALEG